MSTSDKSDLVPPDELDSDEQKVLSVIHLNTNPVQGEWVPERVVKTVVCPYKELSGSDCEDALETLEEKGLIVSSENGYQTAEGVSRPKHPGEK